MNDFTKEELEEILVALDYVRDGIDEFIPSNPLIHKIQCMIDNYSECKHTLTMTDTFVKCQDCKKVIEYDE